MDDHENGGTAAGYLFCLEADEVLLFREGTLRGLKASHRDTADEQVSALSSAAIREAGVFVPPSWWSLGFDIMQGGAGTSRVTSWGAAVPRATWDLVRAEDTGIKVPLHLLWALDRTLLDEGTRNVVSHLHVLLAMESVAEDWPCD